MLKFFWKAPMFLKIGLVALVATCILIAVFVGKAVDNYANSTHTETSSEVTKTKEPSAQPDQNDSIPTSRKILGYILIVIFLLVFVGRMIHARGKTTPWKDILTDTPTLTVWVLMLVWLVIAFLIPRLWLFVWEDQIFFWSLNVGLVVIAILRSLKNSRGENVSPKVAWVFGIILVIGLFCQMKRNPYWTEPQEETRLTNSPTYRPVTSSNAVYSPITGKLMPPQPVADAESGTCGVLGSAKQFLPGTKTPVRNPQNGNPGTGAVGYWGINLSSPAVKSLVENYKVDGKSLDVENNKDHNDAAASLLYEESGLRPWIASKHCWGDKIYGYLAQQPLPYVLDVVSVPVGTWSEEVKNPLINGAKLRWGKLDDYKGGSCKVRFDKNDQKVFLIESSTLNLYPGTLQFQCAEEGAEIRVRVVPK